MAIDIPNYRIVEKLGVGAQSRLYRARCMRTGKDYTVKIIKIAKPEDASFVELLKAEHAIGTAVDHPVVRKVYELRIMRQRLRVRGAILFMEYVEGVAMSEKEFRRPLGDVVRLFIPVAEGLRAMHQQGFVHADLKPNNILVAADDQVKLIDLGQSCRIREAKPRIQGTIDYIAPEQVTRGVLDERTDVFGLAAALHRVATGKAVATEMNRKVTVHSQGLIGKRVSEVDQCAMENMPACVVRFIEDCCQYNPDDRLPHMTAAIERLKLAHTILSKQDSAEDPNAISQRTEVTQSAGTATKPVDPLLEELGLTDPDDSFDFEDFPAE
ncbi:MAG: serine/threonine protein kinase [Phycisphaerae bacterium]